MLSNRYVYALDTNKKGIRIHLRYDLLEKRVPILVN